MWFLFGDEKHDMRIIEKQKTRSLHTGKELEILICSFVINSADNKEAFLKIMDDNKDSVVVALDEKGNKKEEYSIGNTSYNCQSGEVYSIEIELKEKESLNIEALIIEGKKYYPYAYMEEFDDGAFIVESKIELSKEETDALKISTKGKKYFNVIRQGISDDIVSMRFGLCIWSENKETIKHRLVLVQDIYDEKQEGLLNLDTIINNNIEDIAYKISKKLEEVFDLLVDKSIINRDELHENFSIAEDDFGNISNIFYKVKDVDDYKF